MQPEKTPSPGRACWSATVGGVRAVANGATAARLLWISLTLLHVLPIWRVGAELLGSGNGLGSLALLLLAQAFFVLKVCDVRWLCLPYRHGTLISLVLMALIGHGDVAAKGLEHMPMLVPAATVLSAAAVARYLHRRKRLSFAALHPIAAQLRLALNQLATDLLASPALCRSSAVTSPCIGGRAPPLRSF